MATYYTFTFFVYTYITIVSLESYISMDWCMYVCMCDVIKHQEICSNFSSSFSLFFSLIILIYLSIYLLPKNGFVFFVYFLAYGTISLTNQPINQPTNFSSFLFLVIVHRHHIHPFIPIFEPSIFAVVFWNNNNINA